MCLCNRCTVCHKCAYRHSTARAATWYPLWRCIRVYNLILATLLSVPIQRYTKTGIYCTSVTFHNRHNITVHTTPPRPDSIHVVGSLTTDSESMARLAGGDSTMKRNNPNCALSLGGIWRVNELTTETVPAGPAQVPYWHQRHVSVPSQDVSQKRSRASR